MIVILGGGLSGSLLAYRLSQLRPLPPFLLIEAQDRIGGNHTWSFHQSDLSLNNMNWIKDLITCSWEFQEVRFNNFKRILSQPYHSITSPEFDKKMRNEIGPNILLNEPVYEVHSNAVVLKNKKIEAQLIFDARGCQSDQQLLCGYQKFVGIDLEFEKPHGLAHPILMDTHCDQADGYRFFYLLPWNKNSLLIEDTRYSTSPELNVNEMREEIKNYCARSHWTIRRENRIETGSLPIPLHAIKKSFYKSLTSESMIPIGIIGNYFHWTTGYSFGYAVQVAETIAREIQRNAQVQKSEIEKCLIPIQEELIHQTKYLSMLNKMMFLAAKPKERWKIFHRFYRLNESLISRFYQGNLSFFDKARILIGRPPVPISSALKSLIVHKNKSQLMREKHHESA